MHHPPESYTAVILAGGVGKRFRPFVTDKTLFPFMGESLLQRTLDMVEQSGIQKVVIATNRWNDSWVRQYAQDSQLEFQIHQQSAPNGMADALLSLRELLPEDNMVVMNAGDMVAPHLLPELLKQAHHAVTVTGMEVPTYLPLGYFELDGDTVVAIHEKPGADKMPSHLANLVFHVFAEPDAFLNQLEKLQHHQTGDDIYELALTALMQDRQVGLYRYTGPWQKLKFGDHVLDMSRFFLQRLRPYQHDSVQVARSAVLNGTVHLSEGVRVLDGAVIQGPCWIGANVIIGNNALVRDSIIEADSVVGYGSEVVRSYVGPSCDLHHAYVGDSVLEKAVHFGYGAHTANLRFDQQPIRVKLGDSTLKTDKIKLGALIASGAEVGVNSSLMPGITLGTDSLVHPATVVNEAVADRTSVKHPVSLEHHAL